MTNDDQGRQTAPARENGQAERTGRGRRVRLRMILILVAVVLAIFIVPPLISIGRYKSRITQVISQSFGRPVRLSSVEMRLLPWPGFVLTDLTVEEDPAYGAEPVLHANTVTANIRLLSLWQGRLEISSVSVDEASLNVVHAAPGRWNLNPIFRTAAAKAGPTGNQAHRFPYLEATNSRINFKNGAEKLPFSLVNTDLSFWQEDPNEWRLRLRGQPARTDVVLDMGDTGLVRLEATVHRSPQLRNMPVHVDLDWRQAQLGQLSRLLIGYDRGWRGDLTGELHMDGTAEAARVSTRLSATGVHRAEFAPASPLDFDANCGFVYHYSRRAFDNIACDSPLGNGRLRLTGDLPGNPAPPNLTLALNRVSVAAGLDVLRTLRSGIDPDLQAAGTISGKLAYQQATREQGTRDQGDKGTRTQKSRAKPVPQGPLSGSLTVEGFALSGGSLQQPLRVPRIVLEPAEIDASGGNSGPEALAGTITIPAGGPTPLTVNLKLALNGYQAGIHGQASFTRARDLAQMAGSASSAVLNGLAGEPLTANLTAEGPWLASELVPNQALPADPAATATPIVRLQRHGRPSADVGAEKTNFDLGEKPARDSISGSITLHNANWRADYLANRVQIAEATLNVGGDSMRWDPVAFSYGPVMGTATLIWRLNCDAAQVAAPAVLPCAAHFQARFGTLDAGAVEAAFLGARRKSSLFADLIQSFHTESAPLWPAMQGTVTADSLELGPVMLHKASVDVKITKDHADFSGLQADVLGGQAEGNGSVQWATGDQGRPAYMVTASFDKLAAAAVGQLLGLRWSGGPIKGNGKLNLSGLTGKELAASAKGTLHFDWGHGAISVSKATQLPAGIAHFNRWTGDAGIAGGAVTLGKNQLVAGVRKTALEGAVTFGKPPKAEFAAAKQ